MRIELVLVYNISMTYRLIRYGHGMSLMILIENVTDKNPEWSIII